MIVPMHMPALSTNDSPVTILRWLIEPGQEVRRGEPIVEVETDKSVLEVESVLTGTLLAIAVGSGEQASTGEAIATFDCAEVTTAAPPPDVIATAFSPGAPLPAATLAPSDRVSFFARNRRSREKGTPRPAVQDRRGIAAKMIESKRNVPHFYLQTSIDASAMITRRKADSSRTTVWDAFFVHAVGRALTTFGRMACRYVDGRLVPHGAGAVSVAVDVGGRLYTIAIEGPAAKSPEAISDEIRDAVARLDAGDASARVARPASMTVSNLGGSNVEQFVAVINPPESAILAVGKVAPRVVAIDGQVAIQHRANLTLSVDHRVADGKYSAAFLGAIVDVLENLETGARS